jgi:hypothetical protein
MAEVTGSMPQRLAIVRPKGSVPMTQLSLKLRRCCMPPRVKESPVVLADGQSRLRR